MKNGKVIKNVSVIDTAEELALINSYSRRELGEEDVYVFTVALCDNDIDRDFERFTVESLFALEKLFVGKTGIIDHDPSAKNQKARIISCKVEAVQGEKTALGDELFRLTARAYIPRTASNTELIEAIDSGIVKEVSVGCSVERTLCSVCRHDINSPACDHIKGREYGGELCYGELDRPSDAYEFSFVAVPAQRSAGVIKTGKKEKNMKDITKLLEGEKLTLEGEELSTLKDYISALKSDAELVKAYRAELMKKLRYGLEKSGIELSFEVSKSIGEKLSIGEIKEIIGALEKKSAEPAMPQLCAAGRERKPGNTEFTI